MKPNIIDMPTMKPVGKGAMDEKPKLIGDRLLMFWDPRQSTKSNKLTVEQSVERIRILINIVES